jgi:hypothetical protein
MENENKAKNGLIVRKEIQNASFRRRTRGITYNFSPAREEKYSLENFRMASSLAPACRFG